MIKVLKYLIITFNAVLIIIFFLLCIKLLRAKQTELEYLTIPITLCFSATGILLGALTYFFNRETTAKNEFELYYSNLNKDISDASFDNKKGIDAFLSFDLDTNIPNTMLDHINLVLKSYQTCLDFIEKNYFFNVRIKKINKDRLHLLFYSKILWPLHKTMLAKGKKFIEKHDDSKLTIPNYAKLSIECIHYLIENNLVQSSDYKRDILTKLENLKK